MLDNDKAMASFADLPLEIVEEITLLESYNNIYNRGPVSKQWEIIYKKVF